MRLLFCICMLAVFASKSTLADVRVALSDSISHSVEKPERSKEGFESDAPLDRVSLRARKKIHRWFENVRQIESRDKKEKEFVKLIGKLNRKIDRILKMEITDEDKNKLAELKRELNKDLDSIGDLSDEGLDEFIREKEKPILEIPTWLIILFFVGILAFITLIVIVIV